MTSAAATAAPVGIAAKPGRTRLIQAACFGVGAVALAVVVGGGTLSFLWTPAILGLTYLAAAIAGGRDGGHWSTACVLLGWGAGVLSASEGLIGLGAAPLYLAGAGLGGVVAAILERRGFSADLLGVGRHDRPRRGGLRPGRRRRASRPGRDLRSGAGRRRDGQHRTGAARAVTVSVGERAPDLELLRSDGSGTSMHGFRGEATVLIFLRHLA